MSLAEDFALHVTTHLASLGRLGAPVDALATQFNELGPTVARFEEAFAAIQQNPRLVPDAKWDDSAKVRATTTAAVETWLREKTSALDRQSAALQATLVDTTPVPSDVQVEMMAKQLAQFDPLEVQVLYADADDVERRLIEAAAELVGRRPIRRDGALVWEPMLEQAHIDAAIAARAARIHPDASAQLQLLQRIRNTYDALASAALGLLRDSTPSRL